jgi:hypothetical protein
MEDLKVSELIALGHLTGYPSEAYRKTARISPSRLYRSRQAFNGQVYYYFEAKKEYKKTMTSKDQSCSNISFFKGWILQNPRGEMVLANPKLNITDCDMKGVEVTRLLGSLAIMNQVYAITEDHGYEDESYSIFEISRSGIKQLMRIYGGSC